MTIRREVWHEERMIGLGRTQTVRIETWEIQDQDLPATGRALAFLGTALRGLVQATVTIGSENEPEHA